MSKRAPENWADDWQELFLERISGGRSLRDVAQDEDMPSRDYIRRARDADAAFEARYARATEERAEHIFEDILDIADDGERDVIIRVNEDGTTDEIVNHDHIQRSKLRVDARKWVLSRMQPKKYGDKLDVEQRHTVVNISGEESDL